MIRRHLETAVAESLAAAPVTLVTGARQVGKSTLVQRLAKGPWGAKIFTLDDRTVLDAVLRDPDGWLDGLDGPVVIDEVQRAPDLLRAVKRIVDADRRNGRFLLTGSANVMTLSKISETLAGRIFLHELHPFSLAEEERRVPSSVMDALFQSPDAATFLKVLPSCSPVPFDQIRPRVIRGGYPTPALMHSAGSRAKWFESYRTTYIERDIRDLSQVEHQPDFNRLITLLASRTGQLLNVANISRDLGLPYTTLRRYMNLLEVTYQIYLLPSYSTNVGTRVLRAPKLYFTDTGVACHAMAADSWDALERQGHAGALLETWVANELRKMASIQNVPTRLYGWRVPSGREIDFLLMRGEKLVGLEVKMARHLSSKDRAGLDIGRENLGEKLGVSVILYSGTEAMALDRFTAVVPMGVFFGGGPEAG